MTPSANNPGAFVKTYPGAGIAREVLRRSRLARSAGVRTPEAHAGPGPESLSFVRIEGRSGVGLLEDCELGGLLAPLRALHGTAPVGLPAFDPFDKIRPRLAKAPYKGLSSELLARLGGALPSGGGAVHGDFHLGQLIGDCRGEIWVVDLDDMARGPPEADLGNLAAHLATREETAQSRLRDSLEHWRGEVISAWGVACDGALFERYMRIAALRRALKLRERGGVDLLPELVPLLSVA